jgi:hypothetical protein
MLYPHFLQTFYGNGSSIYPNLVIKLFLWKNDHTTICKCIFHFFFVCSLSMECTKVWWIDLYMVYFITMKVEAKFHDSCFNFMWRAMTSEEGYLDTEVLGLTKWRKQPQFLEWRNMFCLLTFIWFRLKGIHAFCLRMLVKTWKPRPLKNLNWHKSYWFCINKPSFFALGFIMCKTL